MIKNVIFDLGGVVLGREYAAKGSAMKAFIFLKGENFPEFWKDFDMGLITQLEVAEAISAQTNKSVDESFALVTEIMHMFDEFPETVELVKRLHCAGYKLYVLSNMPAEYYEYIKNFEVFDYFDGAVISSTEKMAKPDPRFFRLLLDRYGLETSETLFVDDKTMNITAADELGLHTCLFDPSGNGCRDVKEILKLTD